MKPNLEVLGGVYVIKYDNGLRFTISRLTPKGTGIEGVLLLEYWNEDAGEYGHLLDQGVNLRGPNVKRDLAKALGLKAPSLFVNGLLPLDLVEQAFRMTTKRFEVGAPIEALGLEPDWSESPYHLEPLLVKGQPNTIFAPGGRAKSLLAIFLSLLMETSTPACGLKPVPGHVLYLDWESEKRDFINRVYALRQGLTESEGVPILRRRCYMPLVSEASEIQRIIAGEQITVIVVDSVFAATGGDPNRPEPAQAMHNTLRSFEATSVLIDHGSHKPEGEARGESGHHSKRDRARSVWEVVANIEASPLDFVMGLFQRKTNYAWHPPIGLRWQLEVGENNWLKKVDVSWSDPGKDPELVKKMSVRVQVERYLLDNGPVDVKDIADGTGLDKQRIAVELSRGKTWAVRTDKGWAALTQEEPW